MSTSPDDQILTMQRNLEAKTGVTWPEWLDRARAAGSSRHGEIVKHLKTAHGIGHGYANLIAHSLSAGAVGGPPAEDELVDALFAGRKGELKPIYAALIAAVQRFGSDVEVAPKKTYVSLRRKKQFGLVQPSTATRLDVGLNLKGKTPAGRLEPSGSFNAMVSHRVRVGAVAEVDAELLGWLREAYESAG